MSSDAVRVTTDERLAERAAHTWSNRPRSLSRDAARRLARNKAALAGLIVVCIVVLAAIFAPLLAPYSPAEQDLLATYASPSREHPLGTDALGRDILSRLLYGARVSMSVALVTGMLVVLIGVPVGIMAGYFGGKLDFFVMRFVDSLFAFPDLLFIIIVTTYLNAALAGAESGILGALSDLNELSGGLIGVFLALGLFGWLGLSRLVRGEVISVRGRDYITSSRAIGANDRRIMTLHVLPNVLAPIIITVAILMPTFIIAEAGLSFIGLGVQPPNASWGIMISEGVPAMRSHPHVIIVPGVTLSITLLAFNFLGDGLRDALDPFMH